MLPRVTLDDLFPRAQEWDEPTPGVFKCGETHPCWVCGRPSTWADISFEGGLCSMVCSDIGWTRYWRADQTRTNVGSHNGTCLEEQTPAAS
jgi:endogenous inhibitor of DNA gyrase (YacG/DUF329 family)